MAAGDSGFPSGFDKVHVVLWTADDVEITRDTICFDAQDNGSHLSQWVIPNNWTIDGETTTTPVPADGAMGPRIEGTGVGYNECNNGDAYTRATYANGFQLKVDYSFTSGYTQADTPNMNEITGDADPTDDRKVSFVANSGIKIGAVGSGSRYEVAIIDMENWVALTHGIGQLGINGDMIDLSGQRLGAYEDEEVSRLLTGMLYKGEYKSTEPDRGLTDADALSGSLTPDDYRTLLMRTLECWDNSSMIIVADPNATDGKIKVYMKLTEGEHSGHNHTEVTRPTETDYYLFYRTDKDRGGNAIVFNEDTRIHLQSHWGSGVTFSNIAITSSSFALVWLTYVPTM